MLPFILSTIAGFATMLGIIPIFFKVDHNKIINYSLSLAAGIMTSVSIFDLIPEANHLLSNIFYPFPKIMLIMLFVNLGIIFGIIIDKLVFTMNRLYKLGIISLIAIIIHNIPEGIITFLTSTNNITIGLMLTFAILLHNIPEGISIAVPIYYSKKSRGKAILYVLVASLAEPLGALIADLFLKDIEYNLFIGLLSSFTAGIMLQIACFEFIPTIFRKFNLKNLLIYGVGVVIIIITNLII